MKEKFHFQIVSKLPAEYVDVERTVQESLCKLGIQSFYAYLYHNFSVYKKDPGSILTLRKLQEAGKIGKLGFSLYTLNELDYIISNDVHLDFVQIPYSVFDRRFESRFEDLKSRGVEIHVRSAFLQGLAFLDTRMVTPFFNSVIPQLNRLHVLAEDFGMSIADVCLCFCSQNRCIDGVIIGVNTCQNLIANCASISRCISNEMMHELQEVEIYDEAVLLPYMWKKE